jgi:hypothetical protein
MAAFESCEVLFKRAHKHFLEYHVWETAFREEYVDSGFFETDPDSGDILFKAPKIEDPPLYASGIVFDCVNCLRSSLDHAVFDASVVLGGHPKPKYTKFPFGRTADDAGSDLARKRAEVPESIRPFLLSYEPYEAGNHLLWGMNELRNGTIHQILETMTAAPFGDFVGSIGHMTASGGGGEIDKNGNVILMRIKAGAKMKVRPRVLAAVAFCQSTPFPREETDDVLENFINMVGGMLGDIETETWRLRKGRES